MSPTGIQRKSPVRDPGDKLPLKLKDWFFTYTMCVVKWRARLTLDNISSDTIAACVCWCSWYGFCWLLVMIFRMDCIYETNSFDSIGLKTRNFSILQISNSIQVVLEGRHGWLLMPSSVVHVECCFTVITWSEWISVYWSHCGISTWIWRPSIIRRTTVWSLHWCLPWPNCLLLWKQLPRFGHLQFL